MSGFHYYNENDPKAAAWIRQLIKLGLLPEGWVDERSIKDIKPEDLRGYTQCHFFAGIGGWALALAIYNWDPDRPCWTGSCPCQPFSSAGKQAGEDDPRHLWPWFRDLIRECRPPVVFGEQVASAAGRDWLSGVHADLEALGYAFGAADLCAAGTGAPHIRQRLYWVAYSTAERRDEGSGQLDSLPASRSRQFELTEHSSSGIGRLALTDGGHAGAKGVQRGRQQRQQPEDGATGRMADAGLSPEERLRPHGGEGLPVAEADGTHQGGSDGRLAVAAGVRLEGRSDGDGRIEAQPDRLFLGRPGVDVGTSWDQFDLLTCTDGKTRRVEPGVHPLAHGIPGRVGLLRGFGNAIVPELAAQFIAAAEEAQII